MLLPSRRRRSWRPGTASRRTPSRRCGCRAGNPRARSGQQTEEKDKQSAHSESAQSKRDQYPACADACTALANSPRAVDQDRGVRHAGALHQHEQRRGIGRMQPHAAVRGGPAEARDVVRAVDRVALVEEDRVRHRRAVIFASRTSCAPSIAGGSARSACRSRRARSRRATDRSACRPPAPACAARACRSAPARRRARRTATPTITARRAEQQAGA